MSDNNSQGLLLVSVMMLESFPARRFPQAFVKHHEHLSSAVGIRVKETSAFNPML